MLNQRAASIPKPVPPRHPSRSRDGPEVEGHIDTLTIREALRLLQTDELPRRRIDCLLLIAAGRSREEAAETCGLTLNEVRGLVQTVFSHGLAHAILFGSADDPKPSTPIP